MIYCQTINKECIAVHPLDDIDNTYFVEFIKYGDAPMFAVSVCDDEYEVVWEFDMSNPSDYERIKMNVFDAIYTCDTMHELMCALNDIFESYFEEILIVDECGDCDECDCCDECDEYEW